MRGVAPKAKAAFFSVPGMVHTASGTVRVGRRASASGTRAKSPTCSAIR